MSKEEKHNPGLFVTHAECAKNMRTLRNEIRRARRELTKELNGTSMDVKKIKNALIGEDLKGGGIVGKINAIEDKLKKKWGPKEYATVITAIIVGFGGIAAAAVGVLPHLLGG
ncbi:MAG: hypothetical protein AM326_03045 [Candidatus Thorarchaeota archaeon SMTZ-45]|nr:MAG: hypothetical protein AM326_03045 [Candidatus Thorarchaeota archaeon SMTZ-45]